MGGGKVTIKDVAREAGVALGTVSNALNHPSKVKPATLQAVRRAMDTLGYVPNQNARTLAGGKTATFGLVLPQLNHGLSLQIANGAYNEARRHGYDLLIANADDDRVLERHYLRTFQGIQLSGVLVQPAGTQERRLSAGALGIPAVYLDTCSTEPGYFVAADTEAQGTLIAEHVMACGRTRVAVVGKPDAPQAHKRLQGIAQAARLHPGTVFEFVEKGSCDRMGDGFELGRLLAGRPRSERPDAIIGLSDALATGVLLALGAQGLRAPEDIAVAGCDGNPLAWSSGTPLTTCAPPGYEIGRRGVQWLIEQVEAAGTDSADAPAASLGEQEENRQSLVRPFLLARASTLGRRAPAPSGPDQDMDISAYL